MSATSAVLYPFVVCQANTLIRCELYLKFNRCRLVQGCFGSQGSVGARTLGDAVLFPF
jgi:hypothetical protein